MFPRNPGGGGSRNIADGVWSGERRTGGFGFTENEVTVKLEDSSAPAAAAEAQPVREQPKWMMESTIDGAISEPLQVGVDSVLCLKVSRCPVLVVRLLKY